MRETDHDVNTVSQVRCVRLKVIVYPKEDGSGYLAVCPSLQGCHAEGETVGAALDNLQDVAANLLALLKEDGQALPEPAVAPLSHTMDGELASVAPSKLSGTNHHSSSVGLRISPGGQGIT